MPASKQASKQAVAVHAMSQLLLATQGVPLPHLAQLCCRVLLQLLLVVLQLNQGQPGKGGLLDSQAGTSRETA
jgi:hypothetical protein